MYLQNAVDRERLRLASNQPNQLTLEACLRAGLPPGAHAIDVGCDQLGALPVLAELVGPDGVVVGLDSSPIALDAARTSLASLGLDRVHLVEADINSVDSGSLAPWAPFDVAVCRLLLVHQPEPVATLRAITRFMRPGGRIIAMEPFARPGLSSV
jgi:ubiquinone/menaquinone biosynthesis C-methylase UbiE